MLYTGEFLIRNRDTASFCEMRRWSSVHQSCVQVQRNERKWRNRLDSGETLIWKMKIIQVRTDII